MQSQKGFSIIEVIISLAIISVAFSLILLQVDALRIGQKQRYENIAYHIAQKQIEELRGTSFASLPGSGTISDSQLSSIPSGSGNFTIADYPGYTGLKEITVTVSWIVDNSTKSVVLKTLAGNGGINPE